MQLCQYPVAFFIFPTGIKCIGGKEFGPVEAFFLLDAILEGFFVAGSKHEVTELVPLYKNVGDTDTLSLAKRNYTERNK